MAGITRISKIVYLRITFLLLEETSAHRGFRDFLVGRGVLPGADTGGRQSALGRIWEG